MEVCVDNLPDDVDNPPVDVDNVPTDVDSSPDDATPDDPIRASKWRAWCPCCCRHDGGALDAVPPAAADTGNSALFEERSIRAFDGGSSGACIFEKRALRLRLRRRTKSAHEASSKAPVTPATTSSVFVSASSSLSSSLGPSSS